MTIDELRSAAAVVRDATEEGENTATRIGQLFLDTVNTLCDVSTNAIKGYVVISSTSDLPTSPTTEQQMKGYLLGTTLYVWVGAGGDTLDGKYQSAQLKGEPGPQGESGVDLGDVAIADDLTTNDATKVLSAKQGYVVGTSIDALETRADAVEGEIFEEVVMDAEELAAPDDEHGWSITASGVTEIDNSDSARLYYHLLQYNVDGVERVHITATAAGGSWHKDTDKMWCFYAGDVAHGTLLSVSAATPNDGCDETISVPDGASILCVALRTTPSTTRVNAFAIASVVDGLKKQVANVDFSLSQKGVFNLNGAVISTAGNHYHTVLQPTAGYRWLWYATRMGTTGMAVAFFDSEKNFLRDVSIIGTAQNFQRGVVDLSLDKYASVAYVSISFYNTNDTYRLGFYHATLCNDFGAWANPLKVLIFGDSITDYAAISVSGSGTTPIADGGTTVSYRNRAQEATYTDAGGSSVVYDLWPFLLDMKIPIIDLRNYALSGASYKSVVESSASLERKSLAAQVTLAISDADNPTSGVFPTEEFYPNVVIIALGTNDGACDDTPESAMAIAGTDVDDTIALLDETKFCQAARKAFMRIRKKWPLATMFCELPIQRASRDQLTAGVNEALRVMAGYYGMIVIDGGKESGIVRDFEVLGGLGTLLKDGLHPNKNGQRMLARAIIAAVKSNSFDL